MAILMSAKEHELTMAIFINDILYGEPGDSELNIKQTNFHPETLRACALYSIDETWKINKIQERSEGMLNIEEFKRPFSNFGPGSSSLNAKEFSALFFVNHPYVNSYIRDHREQIDQKCSKLGLKSSVELQYIVHSEPNIQYKEFVDRSKISTPLRLSIVTGTKGNNYLPAQDNIFKRQNSDI